MRRRSSSRSGARKIFTASDASSSGGRPSRCHAPSGRPVASSTSSARAIRVRSAGLSSVALARRQLRMQRRRPFGLHPRAHGGADLRRDRRHRRKPLGQRLEVEPGAADQDRHAPGGAHLAQGRLDIREPAPDRIVLRRIDMAIEPVRHARLLLRRRPRRDDAQVAIDLHRVGIDDRAADLPRQRERQRRLAARGRPCDKHRLSGGHFAAMTHVATLISNPARPALDAAALARRASALLRCRKRRAGSIPASPPTFPLRRTARTTKRSRNACAPRSPTRPIDVVVQPLATRRKRLFVADMDSTMIGQECIDELADYAGLKAHVAAITERAMRGEIAFEPALRERVALLKDLPVAVVDDGDRKAHHAHARRAHAGRHHAAQRRIYLPRLRRLHAVHRPRRRDDRVRRASRQHADRRRRKVRRPRRRADPRTRGEARDADRIARAPRPRAARNARGRRRRERSGDDRGRRPRRRLSRQAEGRRRPRMRASTTATSRRCSICRATRAPSSRTRARPASSAPIASA